MHTWVEAYYNLHKKCFSVRHAGRVWFHTNTLTLRNCKFAVQPAGRAKVLKEKKKNVHAFIRGFFVKGNDHTNHRMLHAHQATYNPYKHSTFVNVNSVQPVYEADTVYLNNCWPRPEIYYEKYQNFDDKSCSASDAA